MKTMTSIMPTIKYKNASAAIDWLCHAFGFEKHIVHEDSNGGIAHAQLTFNGGMIMVSSQSDTPYGKLISIPRDLDKINTQSPYIVLDDDKMKEHYDTAVKAGAEVALAFKAEEYGGHSYSVYDPEGHLWNFGSYNPWKD
jgi:uncharacterized glyoxalase superfamily protein PhnB